MERIAVVSKILVNVLLAVFLANTSAAVADDQAKSRHNINLDRVIWWKAIDGLQSGLLFSGLNTNPNDGRIADDSHAEYQVLIRNVSDKRIEFHARMIDHEFRDAPYLIPSSRIAVSIHGNLPSDCRASSPMIERKPNRSAFRISLSPSESVFIPGQTGLDRFQIYIGKDAVRKVPTFARINPGMNWIVHPLQIVLHKDSPKALSLAETFTITKVDASGATRIESVARSTATDGGTIHHPRIQVEVGTLNAAASRNAEFATWGDNAKGLQCGIRLLDAKDSYGIGDVIVAEVLYRNSTSHPIASVLPRQHDLYSFMQDQDGKLCRLDHGARFILLPLSHVFEPNEVRSLGVIRIKLVREGTPSPNNNLEPAHAVLKDGIYQLAATGGVSTSDSGSVQSGSIEVTVATSTKAESKRTSNLRQAATKRVEKLGGNVRRYDKTGVAVDLFGTKAGDKDVEALKCFDLIGLTLTKTLVTDDALIHLRDMSRLGDLQLTRTKISDKGLAALKDLRKLEYLSLCETAVSDSGVKNMSGLKSLVMLNLEKTNITNASMQTVGNLKTLHTLVLSRTKIDDQGVSKLKGLKSLRDLRLDATALSDQCLESILKLSSLQVLTLNSTAISDTGIIKLGALKGLKKLYIQRTSVSQDAVARLQKLLPNCQIVR